MDQQYVRQATAKSNTKSEALAALNSISSKIAQNKLENRKLGIDENLYNYRFDDRGRAYNVNDPHTWNTAGNPTTSSSASNVGKYQPPPGMKYLYDEAGNPEKMEKAAKNGAKIKARNGSIVKALKSL